MSERVDRLMEQKMDADEDRHYGVPDPGSLEAIENGCTCTLEKDDGRGNRIVILRADCWWHGWDGSLSKTKRPFRE